MKILERECVGSLKRAFVRRIGNKLDEKAVELIPDFAAEMHSIRDQELQGDPPKYPWSCMLGDLGRELLELVPDNALRPDLPQYPVTYRALMSYVIGAWAWAPAEKEHVFADRIRKLHFRDKAEIDDYRTLINASLDGTVRMIHDYSIGVMKAARLLASSSDGPMSGDLCQMLARWMGHRADFAYTRLWAEILCKVPPLSGGDVYSYAHLIKPELVRAARTLGEIFQASLELVAHLREESKHLDVTCREINMNDIVIKVAKVNTGLTEEEARIFLASFEVSLYDWRAKSEQPARDIPAKLFCEARSAEGAPCTVEKTF
ncbi:hypothetical protein C4568_02135 [Candidatus Parcubacteria bacterium]|nr:MAG: hypothetical protein C4568_02135 [Candidatus Parcubacteria bacterium]